jgi:hypothetical protein
MRTSSSFVGCLSPLLVSTALPLLLPCVLKGQSTTTQIDYTGSLYGYYRMEFNEPDQKHLPPVASFLAFRKKDPSRLLLGLGDNFGPEFGASIQLENLDTPDPSKGGCNLPQSIDPSTKETRPESLYKDDGRVAPRANCDNVLNFLMHAGFRAIVPGSQDFMYTAQWLRVSALLLSDAARDPQQSAAIDNHDHATNLLGANLLITLKGERCPLLFSQNPLDKDAFRCVGDGDEREPEPLDWLTRLDRLSRQSAGGSGNPTVQAIQQLASESANKAAGRQSVLDELARDELKILQSAWGSRLHSLEPSENDASGRYKSGPQGIFELPGMGMLNQTVLGQILGVLNKLDLADTPEYPLNSADRSDFNTYRASITSVLGNLSKIADPSVPANATREQLQKILGDCAQNGIGTCFVLSADARVAAENGLLRTIAMEEKDTGYTVAHLADGSNVLIIGVTGQNTMKAVSQTNIRLCAGNGKDSENAFGACGDDRKTSGDGTAVAADPVAITEAIVRGAELLATEQNQRPFDKIVVMAQMPHTEAEVLSERISSLLRLNNQQYHVDAVISEAESGFGTLHIALSYQVSAKDPYSAPVVAPIPSYNSQTGDYPGRVSRLTIDSPAEFPADSPAVQSFSLINDPDSTFKPDPVKGSNPTTVDLLSQLMAKLKNAPVPQNPVSRNTDKRDQASKAEFMLLNDLERAAHPNADVVLLQSRDVELDAMGPGYQDYSVCANETEHPELCQLRAALDRIFWKGDYIEYVAVTGKSLKSMIAVSEDQMAQQSQLADTGISQEWLISYGIVQSALTNITDVNQNNEPLWIPVDPSCMGDSPDQSTYCIGGTPVLDDAYYWLVTSDQLAQDKAVYGTLESLPSKNHDRTDIYITAPLSHYLLTSLHLPGPSTGPSTSSSNTTTAQVAPLVPASGTAEKTITSQNEMFQQMPLWQVDFAKVIASFNSRGPVGGNAFVATCCQGVSDPRATAPASQELDLELANRITGTFFRPGDSHVLTPISVGEQTNFAYDRSVLGNLTGKPINASFALNNLIEGAFLQIRLNARSKGSSAPRVWSTPRSLLVLTPHQFQVNIDTPYVFFPYTTGVGDLNVQLPRVSVWTDRGGFREEFGSNRPKSFFMNGSYFETGMEFSTQNGNLYSLTFQDGTGTPKTCFASANVTLQSCFSAAKFVIAGGGATTYSVAVKSLHTPGYYWTLHFQNHLIGKNPGTQINLVTDSSGDYFFGRPPAAELPTQTEYAIPLSLALVLPSLGNLTFAPTYSGFYYKSQRSNKDLVVNSFSIAARWYFARDARVPLRRQIQLQGPASTDQTHTGKGH